MMISLYSFLKRYATSKEKEAYSFLTNQEINDFIKQILFYNVEIITPQVQRLGYDESIELFNLNNIHNTWPTILKNTGITEHVELPVLMRTEHPKYHLYPETIKLIQDHFKDDYDMLKRAK
jgi:hypothetical protein